MTILPRLLFPIIACLGLAPGARPAAAADPFLWEHRPLIEKKTGWMRGQTVFWTLPFVAMQYQPRHPTPTIRRAMQAQEEGRFLEALAALDDALNSGKESADEQAETELLRASFLLQADQDRQVMKSLARFLGTPYAADALALTAMAHVQQGEMREAAEVARRGIAAGDGLLPYLAFSYAMQGGGQLEEAYEAMRAFNRRAPQPIALAREAELALMQDEIRTGVALVQRALEMDAAQPYVVAVSGLAFLMDGRIDEAKTAFETALRRDPEDATALMGSGLVAIMLGSFAEGLKRLEMANEAGLGNAVILTYLGRAQWQAGEFDAARKSWRDAQRSDRKDPVPWLYEARAELEENRLDEAQARIGEAQARIGARSVYRGERLLAEDEHLLQANLAEIQRRRGMEELAFRTLADAVGESNLKNQAELLEGRRFGESARRSLLLQSLFDEKPGSLPAPLDIYGDGAGQTGASTPQHGAVTELGSRRASYQDYDALFAPRAALEADATIGGKGTVGKQVRAGIGNETLGMSVAWREYETDGFGSFNGLDNRVAQAVFQLRPNRDTQAFLVHQTFDSKHQETFFPADPGNAATLAGIVDGSRITRLGLRHALPERGELRALWSYQRADQEVNSFVPAFDFSSTNFGDSNAHSAELQYLARGTDHTTQWGAIQTRGRTSFSDGTATFASLMRKSQQFYVARKQLLGPSWQLDAELGWGKTELNDDVLGSQTFLKRWLPRLGVVYAPDAGTRARLAAWRNLGMASTGDASLMPATLAGILLPRAGGLGGQDNNVNGALVHGVALGADKRLAPDWLLEGQTQRRKTSMPVLPPSGEQYLERWQTKESRLALHWQGRSWAMSLAWDHEHVHAPSTAIALDSVEEQRLRAQQLKLRWFAGPQWTATLALSHNHVVSTLQTNWFSDLASSRDSFNQADFNLHWRFNRRDWLELGVRNAGDTRVRYTDIDPLNPRFSEGRLAYLKLGLAW